MHPVALTSRGSTGGRRRSLAMAMEATVPHSVELSRGGRSVYRCSTCDAILCVFATAAAATQPASEAVRLPRCFK